MSDYGSFECLNCGRSQKKSHPAQKFCHRMPGGPSCKDRYWSRGTRRVSKMNIKLNTLIDAVKEMIGVVKSNQERILGLEIFLNIDKGGPDFTTLKDDFYTHRDQIDHSQGK